MVSSYIRLCIVIGVAIACLIAVLLLVESQFGNQEKEINALKVDILRLAQTKFEQNQLQHNNNDFTAESSGSL